LKKYWELRKNRKGFMSIIIVMFLCALLPFLLFFLVDEYYLYGVKDQFQSFNDRAALAGSLQIDVTKEQSGEIAFNEDKVSEYVNASLILNYKLNDDLTVTADSPIKESPLVKTYVVNNIGNFTTDEGFVYDIKQPTVIVYTEMKPKQIFVSKLITFRSVSAYQASFKTGVSPAVANTKKVSTDGLVVTLNKVTSPLESLGVSPFPLDWQFSPIDMSAGGNMDISVRSENPLTVPGAAEYDLIFDNGIGYLKTIHRVMVKKSTYEMNDVTSLPSDAPMGTKVTVKFTLFTGGILDMMNPTGDQFGIIKSNLHQLVRFQKVYYTSK
jgi:hypothetical protein